MNITQYGQIKGYFIAIAIVIAGFALVSGTVFAGAATKYFDEAIAKAETAAEVAATDATKTATQVGADTLAAVNKEIAKITDLLVEAGVNPGAAKNEVTAFFKYLGELQGEVTTVLADVNVRAAVPIKPEEFKILVRNRLVIDGVETADAATKKQLAERSKEILSGVQTADAAKITALLDRFSTQAKTYKQHITTNLKNVGLLSQIKVELKSFFRLIFGK